MPIATFGCGNPACITHLVLVNSLRGACYWVSFERYCQFAVLCLTVVSVCCCYGEMKRRSRRTPRKNIFQIINATSKHE